MDDKTLAALKASIAKWDRNAEADTPDAYLVDAEDCPLCDLFWRNECGGCPVKAATGQVCCDGSPYIKALAARRRWIFGAGPAFAAHKAVRAEAAFLRSLLPKDTPDE